MKERNNKRVLGVLGSPRRGGNTETILDEILQGATEAGATTEKVILSELKIAPCQACDICRTANPNQCVQQDDMQPVLRQMQQSQIWVLGTPVYWWGPTAQFKTFLDRWYAMGNGFFKDKRIVLAVPLGDTDTETARHTVGMLTDALKYVEAELFHTLIVPGVHRRGEVLKHPELLAQARKIGHNSIKAT